MLEIEAILAKYDLCGSIIVCSDSHAENRHILNASWSAVYFKPDTGELRIRAKKAEFASMGQFKKVVGSTVGMLFQMRDLSVLNVVYFDEMCQILDERFDIEHHPYHGFEPHIEKKN